MLKLKDSSQTNQNECGFTFLFSIGKIDGTELLVNQAKLDSIEVSDEQVDAEMENRLRIIEKDMGGRDKLEEFYGKTTTQIKEEFRSIINIAFLAQEMERTITTGIPVTPKEAFTFFEALPKDSIPFINMKLSFQQIVIYPDITPEDKKEPLQS